MSKRFLVFIVDPHRPRGGWNDFRQSFVSYDEAMFWMTSHRKPNQDAQIVDTLTGEMFVVRETGVEWCFAHAA